PVTVSPSAYSSSASRSEDRGGGRRPEGLIAEGVVFNSQNIQTYDTNSTTTTPRITQQAAESRTIQPSSQPSNTTPIRQDSQDTATERPTTPQPSHNGSTPTNVVDNLSETEFDEDGLPFILSSNGSTTFGKITEDTGLTPAPIKLSLGNSKYGLTHIEKRHGKQIRNAGFDSVEEFVEYVCRNYKRIKQGENSVGEENGTYLIQIEDTHNNTLYIELSTDGNYWGVNSGGVFRNEYGNNKKEVWSAPEMQSNNSAVVSDGLQSEPIADNGSTSNGNPSNTSSHKGTSSSSQSQEINEEINKQAAQPDKTNNPISYNKETNTWHNVPGKWFTSKPDRFGNITAWGDHNRIQLHYNNGTASIHVIIQDNYAETPARMIDNIETAGFDIQYSGEKLPFVKFQTFDEALAFAQYLDQLEQQIHQSSSDNNTITPNDSYTITPTQYTTKRGNVLDMQLVKFTNDLTKEQYRTAKELAKADKGWYDRDKGGFMMRSEESAKQLADTILNNDDAVSNAQPVSMTEIQSLNDGDTVFTEPVTVSPSAYSSSASRSEDRGGGRRPEGLNQDNNSAE
ncbi:MAG: hypothetical protein U0L54_00495, partial [Bacteroidales bacterium]|nr:hypothetical protein [Bacteroidales bacterium]